MFLFFTLLSAIFINPALAQDAPPWPQEVSRQILEGLDQAGQTLPQVLFDKMSDIKLFGVSEGNFSAAVRVGRKVYDNQDLLSTYSVVDSLTVDVAQTLWAPSIPIPNAPIPSLDFTLGIGGTLQITNIRQVAAARQSSLPRVEQVQQEWEEGQIIPRTPDYDWYRRNPSLRPRFNQIFNLVTSPFKLPFRREGLRKLKDGELLSWSASGTISAGVNVSIMPISLPENIDIGSSAGASVFLKGEYRVTLLKEDDRYVRVKLTKVRSHGASATVGASTNSIEVFEGFLVFAGTDLETRILGQSVSVVPFSFTWAQQISRQFDMAFRYDLHSEKAAEAFEKSMLGMFGPSSELATEEGSGVSQILTRSSIERARTQRRDWGLSWIIKGGTGKERRKVTAFVRLPDGQHQVLKESASLSQQWSAIWGTGETKNYSFTLAMVKGLTKDRPEFILSTEALIEDKRTSAKEMHHYVSHIESIVGDETLLPELPLMVPSDDERERFVKTNFKQSSFYFGQNLSQNQIDRFVLMPEVQMERLVKEIFGTKRWLKAIVFKNRWRKLNKGWQRMSQEQRMHELADLLHINGVGLELMKTLIASQNGSEMEYFLTATNQSFGRLQYRGKKTTDADRILELADESVNFERLVGSYRPNANALMEEYKFENKDGKLWLSFKLPVVPKAFFFRMVRTSPWKRHLITSELLYVNGKHFSEGENKLEVGSQAPTELGRYLAQKLAHGHFYTLTAAATLDGFSWGRANTGRTLWQEVIPED